MVSLMVGSSGSFGLSIVVSVGSGQGVAASSATLSARSTACLSGKSCVDACGEPCGVNVGDTASSSTRVARSTLCSIERADVDWIVDRSSGLSPTKPHCLSRSRYFARTIFSFSLVISFVYNTKATEHDTRDRM